MARMKPVPGPNRSPSALTARSSPLASARITASRKATKKRTKDALAAKKARGELPGRPAIGPKVRSRIERQRRRGWTYQRIADGLNHDGIPTARGGAEWRPSSVATGLGYRQKPRRHRAELPTLGRRRS